MERTGHGVIEVTSSVNTTTLCGFLLSQGDINSEDWASRLGFGRKASNLTLENIYCYEISNKSCRDYRGTKLEGQRETTKNLSQDIRSVGRDLNPEPSEYERRVKTTGQQRSFPTSIAVKNFSLYSSTSDLFLRGFRIKPMNIYAHFSSARSKFSDCFSWLRINHDPR
jgi:hypothetical protein